MFQSEEIIAWLKQHPLLYNFARHKLYSRFRSFNRRNIFLNIYRDKSWEGGATASGIGSTLEGTAELRAVLPGIIAKLEIKSLLDIPCGDFFWMRSVPLGITEYIGADLVGEVIEQNKSHYSDRGHFVHLDLLRDPLPLADAILCRDCLIHLSLRDVCKAVQNVKRTGSRYFMTTTYPDCVKNVDTVVPYWRPLNFEIAPFGFLKPLFLIKDFSDTQKHEQGKYLGVWATADIAL